jgi:hypothetical protein
LDPSVLATSAQAAARTGRHFESGFTQDDDPREAFFTGFFGVLAKAPMASGSQRMCDERR